MTQITYPSSFLWFSASETAFDALLGPSQKGKDSREMVKKCAGRALIRLLRGFFGFGGFFFDQLVALVFDGGPESGGAAAADHVTRSN